MLLKALEGYTFLKVKFKSLLSLPVSRQVKIPGTGKNIEKANQKTANNSGLVIDDYNTCLNLSLCAYIQNTE